MRQVLWCVAALVVVAGAAEAQVREAPTAKRDEFIACFNAARAEAEARHPTPERFQMVIEGACLEEQQASLQEFEAYIKSWSRGYDDLTARTMERTRASYTALRAQTLSRYALDYDAARN